LERGAGVAWNKVPASDLAEAGFVADYIAGGTALWNIKYLHINRQAGSPDASVTARIQGAGNLAHHPASPMGD
jgi:hypothetical protein